MHEELERFIVEVNQNGTGSAGTLVLKLWSLYLQAAAEGEIFCHERLAHAALHFHIIVTDQVYCRTSLRLCCKAYERRKWREEDRVQNTLGGLQINQAS